MTSSSARRSEQLQTLAFLLVGWGAFAWPFLRDGVPYYRDVLRTDLPVRAFIGEALRAGRLPQWYPYDGLGIQLIGNAEGLFHPLTWLYAWVNPLTGIRWEVLLASAGALLGAAVLGKELGLGIPARVTSAYAFTFCGYAIGLQSNLPYLRPYATMPWVVWAALKAVRSGEPRGWIALTGLLWASVYLGGDPLTFLLLGVVLASVGWVGGGWRRLGRLAVSGVLAAGLTSVSLFPGWALFRESERAHWVGGSWLGTNLALQPTRLPELWLGALWPNRGEELALRYALDAAGELWVSSLFVGVIVLLLATSALRPRKAADWIWPALALFFFWAALGERAGLHPLLRFTVPALRVFRYPEKYAALGMLALSVSAGIGLERLSQGLTSRQLARRWLAPALGLACLTLLWVARLPQWISFWLPGPFLPAFFDDARSAFTFGALGALAFGACGSGALGLALARPRALLLVPALVLAELFVGNAHFELTVPRRALADAPPFCDAAHGAGVHLGVGRILTRVTRYPEFYEASDGEAWARTTLDLMEPDTSGLCGLESVGPLNLSGIPSRSSRALKALGPELVSRLFDVAAWVVEAGHERDLRVLARADRYALVEPGGPSLPRAFAADPVWVDSADAALARLAHGLEAGDVVVEGSGELPAARGAPGIVRVTQYTPEEVRLDAQLDRPQMVVLGDLFSAGWRATVDSIDTPIYPANAAVRAVRVPSGHHEVVFRYRTPNLGAGAAVTLVSLALCVGLISTRRLRRRPGSDAPALAP